MIWIPFSKLEFRCGIGTKTMIKCVLWWYLSLLSRCWKYVFSLNESLIKCLRSGMRGESVSVGRTWGPEEEGREGEKRTILSRAGRRAGVQCCHPAPGEPHVLGGQTTAVTSRLAQWSDQHDPDLNHQPVISTQRDKQTIQTRETTQQSWSVLYSSQL